jgi:hypothetical protein
MPTPSRQRRRALELLAGSPDGCTEAILLAHGFPVGLLAKLIDAGLATAHAERMMVGGRPMEGSGSRTPVGAQSRGAPSNPRHGPN